MQCNSKLYQSKKYLKPLIKNISYSKEIFERKNSSKQLYCKEEMGNVLSKQKTYEDSACQMDREWAVQMKSLALSTRKRSLAISSTKQGIYEELKETLVSEFGRGKGN